jgi:FtsP/CotA-like multicopper oxidase with cupredoxin domain
VSNGARIGLLVGTVVVLVLAFVLLSPGDDDELGPATTPTAAAPATTTAVRPPPPPAPTFETIRVRDGKPVGGVQTITVEKGDRVRIRITSTDTSDEIHLHGYDKYANVAPGRSARVVFTANAEGIYEIELHSSATQIGKLVVEP